jgi:shikimate dehydrogenase
MPIDGHTRLYAHIGHPTGTFKAPLIYNPYFEAIGANACVVPMGVLADDLAAALPAIFRMSNVDGALITMPHKVAVVPLLARVSPAAEIAGSCNAVKRGRDGGLIGDMFDGEGFARGLARKVQAIAGKTALVAGAGGVGSAIAAALAARGLAKLALFDARPRAAEALAQRLAKHYPTLDLRVGSSDPSGFDIVANATPLGTHEADPLPLDPARLDPGAFVGEVVLNREITPLLAAAQARGCRIQIGLDMLFEQIPAYLEFFGLPTTTPETLRAHARLKR